MDEKSERTEEKWDESATSFVTIPSSPTFMAPKTSNPHKILDTTNSMLLFARLIPGQTLLPVPKPRRLSRLNASEEAVLLSATDFLRPSGWCRYRSGLNVLGSSKRVGSR